MSLSNGMDLSNVNSGNSSAPVDEGETTAAASVFNVKDDFLLFG